MTARVLVVDDILANVKLLEAKLSAEYFDVMTAMNGVEALELIEQQQPDIILLDVMMPGMDGFEVCRRIKSNADLLHIPIVMVTALDQPSDRVQGLEAGADDFLTKPVNDLALFARVRSLVRLKMMTDELRMREATSQQLGVIDAPPSTDDAAEEVAQILLVEDRPRQADRLIEALPEGAICVVEADSSKVVELARENDYDLIIVSMAMQGYDSMRLCSQIRSTEETRQSPILVIVEDGDTERLVRALDIGVNDYLMRPVDKNEFHARVGTQIRRKRYAERLRANFQMSLEMAITDPLTGLYNRRYMNGHLKQLLARAMANGKPLSLAILDIDHFKTVNDTYGHTVGDDALKEFARRMSDNVRGVDLAARYGGEEFVLVMPDTDVAFASMVAERLRTQVGERPFEIGGHNLEITVSIGFATADADGDTPETLIDRADKALFHAKSTGRNRVVLNKRPAPVPA